MFNTIAAFAILCLLCAIPAVFMLGRYAEGMKRDIKSLQDDNRQKDEKIAALERECETRAEETRRLNERVADFEDSFKRLKKTGNPQMTDVILDDATAISLDMVRQAVDAVNYLGDRANQITALLGTARYTPGAYNEDQPSGKRKGVNPRDVA